ncbi:MAG: aminotransferase class I/II-fold pyridoxal phosphate-dependent enzyme [Bacteroidales bacterium]|jgi:dTDP-4-amino-4,6-dideoxygalactose transaminase|nr:aminotransferase class I/II-fold pyridoxal phosphate-dependent enzyme [Bacteroidales bacterium]
MGGREQDFVKEAFDTNWVAPLGPNVDGFERDLQEYTGSAHAAALSSGTAAIHLSLILLGVKPGDHVICQSLTFSASANPIAYQGAIPVFIDSEPDTWNMCPDALKQALKELTAKGKKPKAIIPVHLYGMPARMEEIMQLAGQYEVPIVEDAAEALGSEIKGRRCGSFGKLGVLSFNGNKIITTSGGGALLSADEALILKARFLATQARDPAPHYQHSQIGYNYRMSNVLAGIGRGQMLVLQDRLAQRRSNFEFYHDLIGGIAGVEFLMEPEGFFSNRWLTTLLVDPQKTGGITPETIRLAFEKENIESRPLWKPMHLQPVFENHPYFGGRVAETLFKKGLCLPSGSNMTEQERERIRLVLKNLFGLK